MTLTVQKMSYLIRNDISRCNDSKCKNSAFCARFIQLRFDKENGNTLMSVTDFLGRENDGLCDSFISSVLGNVNFKI